MKILFLLKKKISSGSENYSVLESGLLNSARMTLQALEDEFGIDGDLDVIADGNAVDKAIHQFKPKIVVLEAVWVTPKKLKELVRLHPKVIFIIRIHSEVPYLAQEGVSIEWILEYAGIDRVYTSFNSRRTREDFNDILDKEFFYLPNIYEDIRNPHKVPEYSRRDGGIPDIIDVGCFGAIRPMKNHLQQAVAALSLAEKHRSLLYFHINASRLEQGGQAVLKNLRALFDETKHVLVEHPWMEREEFLSLIEDMDVGMQVSFNESFNIVTADFVKVGKPIIVSSSISWMPEDVKVSTEVTKDMVQGLEFALNHPRNIVRQSRKALDEYNERAITTWRKFLF